MKPIGKRIAAFAKRLEENIPASERWFRDFWFSNGLNDPDDRFNEPFGKRIPDVINHKFKYIIEIDGSIHGSTAQQKIDKAKDRYYEQKGYSVVRLVAFSEADLLGCVEIIERIRTRAKPASVILRRKR